MNRKQLFQTFKLSARNWLSHNSPVSAAALTFFIVIPLPSLLVIVVYSLSLFLGHGQAQQQLTQQISSLAGPTVAGLFKDLIGSASSPFASFWTALVVIAFSVGGAIGAFAVLRDAMDVIWEVKVPRKRKLVPVIKEKIGPFAVVSVLGVVVIAWTIIANTIFSEILFVAVNQSLERVALTIAEITLSFAITAVLFAVIYKMIPQADVHWKDAGFASVVTSLIFTIVNYALGAYVQTFTVTTIPGAAGSLIIILLWIYILNQIILFGAEVAKAYASTYSPQQGSELPPEAEKVLKPLKEAGEKVEEATKGKIEAHPTDKHGDSEGKQTKKLPVPQAEKEKSAPKVSQGKDAHVEPSAQSSQEIEARAETERGSVEVTVKIQRKRKNLQK